MTAGSDTSPLLEVAGVADGPDAPATADGVADEPVSGAFGEVVMVVYPTANGRPLPIILTKDSNYAK
ncbi:hypothetical protein BIFGAL_02956 [Bifidobacterium gallicum DSM 20093 = LMG 11596]|uniref:Uncharacterized protein n=1 Tax=Bifidobacterium gallicum DSM 20093 = LMG 11596 TaxID=561180 RepID=D1NT45_9BIFI|nr:hypothetical protein BIFGAL_02956 [Bifidobacterium gallicum DSM 20093 = LMG 11596]